MAESLAVRKNHFLARGVDKSDIIAVDNKAFADADKSVVIGNEH